MRRRTSIDPSERALITRALGHNPNSERIIDVARQFNRAVSQVSAISMGRSA